MENKELKTNCDINQERLTLNVDEFLWSENVNQDVDNDDEHRGNNNNANQRQRKFADFSIAPEIMSGSPISINTTYQQPIHGNTLAVPNSRGQTNANSNGFVVRTVGFSRTPSSNNMNNSYAASLSGQSRHSHSEYGGHIQRPSTTLEKTKMTRRYLASVLSIIYTIFLIVFGGITFIFDAATDQRPFPEIYLICLILISFVYFIYIYIDIRVHVHKAHKIMHEREQLQEAYENYLASLDSEEGPIELCPGDRSSSFCQDIQIPVPAIQPTAIKPLLHKYCFLTGRHGEFLYLKIGATWFCLGLLIHSCLIITYEIAFITSVDPDMQKCASQVSLAYEILFPAYSLFILFFTYKYINVIINYRRELARFMFMHGIGTCLTFWVHKIIKETTDAIILYEHKSGTNEKMLRFENHWTRSSTEPDCPGPDALNTIYKNFSPYLYPFMIEFCILMAGVFYMMWSHISQCPKKQIRKISSSHNLTRNRSTASFDSNVQDFEDDPRKISRSTSEYGEYYDSTIDHDTNVKTNLELHIDCHATNRGLFAGLVLIVLTICFIILFFVATMERAYFKVGLTLDGVFELLVLVVMCIASILAYIQTSKLDINSHKISKLDDVLLFIAIPAFFSYTIFTIIPAISNGSILNISIVVVQVTQVLIQTPLIIDGLRRCSNSKYLRKNKPGRELITFLTIANVSLWLYYTFSVKTADTGDLRYKFYGYTLWNILSHLSLPLIMFYRFHASVCLVDIWKHSYEKAGH